MSSAVGQNDATAFDQRMSTLLCQGAVHTAIGFASRVGLLEHVSPTPTSLRDLAQVSGVHWRYVREVCGALVCGDILLAEKRSSHSAPEASAAADLDTVYVSLPSHRRATLLGMGKYCEELPLLSACAFLSLTDSGARLGTGLGYDSYTPFTAYMGALARNQHKERLVQAFIPSVDGGRMHKRMKEVGVRVADAGCGEGVALVLMAKAYPRSKFVGYDICQEALETARLAASEEGLDNIEFRWVDFGVSEEKEGSEVGDRYDWITAFDSIHDQTHPEKALEWARKRLCSDGCFSLVDIKASSDMLQNKDNSFSPFLYTVSLMHCMPVGMGKDGEGAGLGMVWGEELAMEMLQKAGFGKVVQEDIPGDSFNVHYLCRAT